MKPLLMRRLISAGLLLSAAGCGATRLPAFWVPGTYYYMSALPGVGPVTGSIVVIAEGPLSITSNVGGCEPRFETVPNRTRERDGRLLSRSFLCGLDHRVSVILGRDGGAPIEGWVSNQRTDTVTTWGQTTCREYETLENGGRICVAWNEGPKTERRIVGSTVQWHLLPDSIPPQR
jgi:hypothetical protein